MFVRTYVHEELKADGAVIIIVRLMDELENIVLLHVKAKGAHEHFQLVSIDRSGLVRVE